MSVTYSELCILYVVLVFPVPLGSDAGRFFVPLKCAISRGLGLFLVVLSNWCRFSN